MPRLRLVDDGYPFKKIMQGSKWIGRVYRNAQGTWTGQIGKNASRIEVSAATDREAFMEVGARYLGQPDAATLARHNSAVRSQRAARRAEGRDLIDNFLRRIASGNRARGLRGGPNNDGLSNEALQAQVDAERERRQRAAEQEQEQESNEDDFVPPVGRRH